MAVPIDIPSLEQMSNKKRLIREFVEEFTMPDGLRINLLGEGHPSSVMDVRFANQAIFAEYLKKENK